MGMWRSRRYFLRNLSLSASQQAVGTAVFGGMMASTALAVLFVPVFFVIFQRMSEFKRKPKKAAKAPSTASTG